jgi:hypothetical protein
MTNNIPNNLMAKELETNGMRWLASEIFPILHAAKTVPNAGSSSSSQ